MHLSLFRSNWCLIGELLLPQLDKWGVDDAASGEILTFRFLKLSNKHQTVLFRILSGLGCDYTLFWKLGNASLLAPFRFLHLMPYLDFKRISLLCDLFMANIIRFTVVFGLSLKLFPNVVGVCISFCFALCDDYILQAFSMIFLLFLVCDWICCLKCFFPLPDIWASLNV